MKGIPQYKKKHESQFPPVPLREAAKKSSFLVAGLLRGGRGG